MQISTGQDGIQRLLAAEQEAQKIVTAARKGWSALINVHRPYAVALDPLLAQLRKGAYTINAKLPVLVFTT